MFAFFSITNFINAENLKEEDKIIHHSKKVSIKIWSISLLAFFYVYFSIIMFVHYMERFYILIFFQQISTKYYTIQDCVSPQMWNCGCGC